MVSVESLIEQITQAATFKYPSDRLAPGLTISYLKNKETYVSIVRWCPDKKVVVSARNDDLLSALQSLALALVKTDNNSNPVETLRHTLELNGQLPEKPLWPCPDPFAYEDNYFPDYDSDFDDMF